MYKYMRADALYFICCSLLAQVLLKGCTILNETVKSEILQTGYSLWYHKWKITHHISCALL